MRIEQIHLNDEWFVHLTNWCCMRCCVLSLVEMVKRKVLIDSNYTNIRAQLCWQAYSILLMMSYHSGTFCSNQKSNKNLLINFQLKFLKELPIQKIHSNCSPESDFVWELAIEDFFFQMDQTKFRFFFRYEISDSIQNRISTTSAPFLVTYFAYSTK